MPVNQRRDKNGPYFQWGSHGKKYYYKADSNRSKEIARQKAARQGRAIKASQAKHFFMRGGDGSLSIDYNLLYQKYKQLYVNTKQ